MPLLRKNLWMKDTVGKKGLKYPEKHMASLIITNCPAIINPKLIKILLGRYWFSEVSLRSISFSSSKYVSNDLRPNLLFSIFYIEPLDTFWNSPNILVTFSYFCLHFLICAYISLFFLTFPYISLFFLTFPYFFLFFLTFPYFSLFFLTFPYISLHFLIFPYISLLFLSLPFLYQIYNFRRNL